MKVRFENSYKRDYKKAMKQGILGDSEFIELDKITKTLIAGQALDPKYKDHALQFDYKGCRDCHIKSDLVLVYRIILDTIYFVRIGRHQDIFKGY
ncbi:type II toxin-antitoxin system YafQ family toxin [Campylobacter troglodytis]|uniref:type II toxin-antitoxin system YafQ family toxin n=1 Tax=Campylobacter troglodytis TaxID=654363 RepID=UPI0011585DDB|nr:type II toxin-antitoxin system YafQ family toxin [Campylobacter troglodytis]TQR55809.1 type II toxin-antitoxin system YafQ family toxin [Campylobacter troglodytis]